MRDIDIRSSLLSDINDLYSNDSETRIVEEFGICEGKVRIDVAVVNGILAGFEIKSDRDTLGRLPTQQHFYSQIFDNVVIIVGKAHSNEIRTHIPEWWGIWLAEQVSEKVLFHVDREAKNNKSLDPYSIAQLLWRDEAIELCKKLNMDKSTLKQRKSILWQELAKTLPIDILKDAVRNQLKARTRWRIPKQPV